MPRRNRMYEVESIIVVTRHKALYKYLVEKGIVPHGTPCFTFATPPDVAGKHVYGILPFWLASKADKYTEIQMRIPKDKTGKELTLEELRFLAVRPVTYVVREIAQ